MQHSLTMSGLICIKKEYQQVFESKNENWRKKHDCKNLKDLDYQADKVKEDEAEKEKRR